MAESSRAHVSKRSIWSGSISIGLVNVPVKMYPMIFDKSVSFKFLHKTDGQPLKYQRVCIKEDKVVDWDDVVRGYEVRKGQFIVFQKEELDAVRPQSDSRIRIDKFVDYLSIDPIYFESTYALAPDKSDEVYSLLLSAFQQMGKAGAGRITLRTKEYPAIVHARNGALLLSTMRYAYEVADPCELEELKELKEPSSVELDLAKRIITDLSGEFDIAAYRDSYKEKVEELIKMKMKGETITLEKPVKEEARELMTALQETLKQLKKR